MDQQPSRSATTLAGRYDLGRLLGRGGMGEVREAIDRRLDRAVAVKILRLDLAEQPLPRRRFETEAHAAARLVHPNVVMVFDSGEEEGVPFLVMERLPGPTLADELATGPMPVERVRSVALEILAALGAAHTAGIIHRDIKPGNVLLTADGHVKVSDFGIAKTVDDTDQTQTLELIATPAYLAPERLAGDAASKQSDLYSVGVLLYEALAGRRPFAGDTHVALMRAIERGHPTPMTSSSAAIPIELALATERAMSRDPRARFDSAEAMAAAIEETPATVATTEPIGLPDETETVPIDVSPPDHAETQHLSTALRSGEERTLPARRRALVITVCAAVLAVAGIGALESKRDTNHPVVPSTSTIATPPGSTAAPGTRRLPAPLDDAIRKLEQAINK